MLLGGPDFAEWSAGVSLAVIFGCAAVVATMGWIAGSLAASSLIGRPTSEPELTTVASAPSNDCGESERTDGDGAC